jgi:hypothetical protein
MSDFSVCGLQDIIVTLTPRFFFYDNPEQKKKKKKKHWLYVPHFRHLHDGDEAGIIIGLLNKVGYKIRFYPRVLTKSKPVYPIQ